MSFLYIFRPHAGPVKIETAAKYILPYLAIFFTYRRIAFLVIVEETFAGYLYLLDLEMEYEAVSHLSMLLLPYIDR